MKKQKVLIIVGPTSSGKSALAVELARTFDGEVISADSRQVYRDLDIGTGKISKHEMKGVPHYLLDVASPKKQFSADDFVKKGAAAVSSISHKNKLPIVAGGTGFYIDALVGRIVLPNVPPNAALRARLEKKSVAQLFALLMQRDPRRAKTIEPQHKRRIIRAIEIAAALGKNPVPRTTLGYECLWIGIAPKMNELEKKINVRLLRRTRNGMVAEARRLHAKGFSYARMEEIGLEYRSLARFLQHKITRAEMLAELQRDIRRYGKRQMRYWSRNTDIHWFAPSEKERIYKQVRRWLDG